MNILITGGAGFIGCNAVKYFAAKGHKIFVIDNLLRETARVNLKWLQDNQVQFNFEKLDITDKSTLECYFSQHKFDVVIHLAAQVAVTLSVQNPRYDFDVNALGSFNVLECVRLYCPDAVFINASTNKVYGKLSDKRVAELNEKYIYANEKYLGVDETQNLEFYSPYGCSKGIADQYALDYARIYGIRSVSVRQSCIYGPHQLGIADQGWISWFIIAYFTGKPIKIYGNGKQVRDVLYVSDLIEFYDKIIKTIDDVKGQAFNMGGGMQNSISLLQFFKILESITGSPIETYFDEWRPGDQYIFISDNSKAEKLLDFRPKVGCQKGIELIYKWLFDYYSSRNMIFVKQSKALQV
jgi:CDP-paratose 2-epimerase